MEGLQSARRTEVLLMRLTPALTNVNGVLDMSWFMIATCWSMALSGTSPLVASPRAAGRHRVIRKTAGTETLCQ